MQKKQKELTTISKNVVSPVKIVSILYSYIMILLFRSLFQCCHQEIIKLRYRRNIRTFVG